MTKRYTIRKDSGDPEYPWRLSDPYCPSQGQHDFSADFRCPGKCDGYESFEHLQEEWS